MKEQSVRFWEKVEKTETCWTWTGTIHKHGYGRFYDFGNHPVNAHRWVWESINGKIPNGMQIDHICHNPEECSGGYECKHRRCVNPAHLKLVTAQENLRRRSSVIVTECPAGHVYDKMNTYITPSGYRSCIECNRIRSREYQRRKARKVII